MLPLLCLLACAKDEDPPRTSLCEQRSGSDAVVLVDRVDLSHVEVVEPGAPGEATGLTGPLADGRLLLVEDGVVKASDDGGCTWEEAGPLPEGGTRWALRSSGARAWAYDTGGAEVDGAGLGARSDDGGQTWEALPPPEPLRWLPAPDPEDPERLVALASGVWTSEDGGATWAPSGDLAPWPQGNSDAAALGAGGHSLAMGGAELWVSENGGGFWQERGEGLPATAVDALTWAAEDPSTLFARVRDDAGAVYLARSYDFGHTWATVLDEPLDFTDDGLLPVPGEPLTVLTTTWTMEGSSYRLWLGVSNGHAFDRVELGAFDALTGVAVSDRGWVLSVARWRAE